MAMKPLSNIHLQKSTHLSRINVSTKTLRTASLRSLKEVGPDAKSENSVDVRAAAAMCQYAYSKLSPGNNPTTDLIDGWKPLDKTEVNNLIAPGFYMKLQNKSNGFSSMLFQKQADGIQYYAYCTVGTDELIDWASNGTQWLTGLATQYTYSVNMAKQIDRAIGNKAVLWFIGHSLGGGLASNNSLVTGRHAITFNAAGLNPLRINATLLLNNWKDLFHPIKRTQRVHAFGVEGELLNVFYQVFYLVPYLYQPSYGDKKTIKLKQSGIDIMTKHSMTTILDHLGMKYY